MKIMSATMFNLFCYQNRQLVTPWYPKTSYVLEKLCDQNKLCALQLLRYAVPLLYRLWTNTTTTTPTTEPTTPPPPQPTPILFLFFKSCHNQLYSKGQLMQQTTSCVQWHEFNPKLMQDKQTLQTCLLLLWRACTKIVVNTKDSLQ